MKKFLSIFLSLAIILCSVSACFGAEFNKESSLWTDTYLVMDFKTGEILAGNNIDKRMYPASLTKMLTAIIAYEHFTDNYNYPDGLDSEVQADDEAADTEPTRFGLKNLELMTVRDAINIMLCMSANDIAVMLAKNIAGTTEHFARLMNEKLEEIGCSNTHFVTPNGLHDDDHYSTAEDLAKIARYLMNIDFLAGVVCQPYYDYPATNKHSAGTVTNTNLLMSDKYDIYVGGKVVSTKYEGGKVLGIKTGTTPEAGGCLMSLIEEGGTQVLVVILNSRSGYSYNLERYADAHVLFDWAFANYRTVKLVSAGEPQEIVKVKRGEFNKVRTELSETILKTLSNDISESAIRTESEYVEYIEAPAEAGTKVGTLHIFLGNDEIASEDIITAEAIAKGGPLSVFGIEDSVANKIFKGVGIALFIILVMIIALLIVRAGNKRKAKRRKAAKAKRMAELEAKKRQEWEKEYEKKYSGDNEE